MECVGPYISFVVVTRHDTNPGLFNTKFRLNFGRMSGNTFDELGFSNSLLVGRSSTCNMVLDYRTVSTIHAKITHEVTYILILLCSLFIISFFSIF